MFMLLLLLLLLPDFFLIMRSWRKTRELQKPGNSLGPGPEIVERDRVIKERALQGARNWKVQNEMKVVPGLDNRSRCMNDSANFREIRVQQKTVSVAAKTKRNTASLERGPKVPQWNLRKTESQRISIKQYTSSPRKDKSGYERKEERKTTRDCRGQE